MKQGFRESISRRTAQPLPRAHVKTWPTMTSAQPNGKSLSARRSTTRPPEPRRRRRPPQEDLRRQRLDPHRKCQSAQQRFVDLPLCHTSEIYRSLGVETSRFNGAVMGFLHAAEVFVCLLGGEHCLKVISTGFGITYCHCTVLSPAFIEDILL